MSKQFRTENLRIKQELSEEFDFDSYVKGSIIAESICHF